MVRVALFVPKLDSGGAERVFVDYANGLAEIGHQVHLICLEGGSYEGQLSADVRLHRLGVRMRFAVCHLWALLRRLRPGVLMSGLTGANLVAVLAGRAARIPRIWISVHNDLSNAGAVKHAVFGRTEGWLIRLAATFADGVVAVSQGVETFLVKGLGINATKVFVVHNPVFHDGILEQARGDLPDKLSSELAGAPYIVGAGRLVEQKGFDLLLEAFSRACPASSPVRLVILGEGPQRAALEEQILQMGLQGRVILAGFVNNPHAVFARAQLFVLSSRWEGFGNVIVEALGCGVPAVAFDCKSGPREILGELDEQLLVPAGDVEALSQMIAKFLSDQPVEGHACVARASYFSRRSSAHQLVALFSATHTLSEAKD